ncbi:MAG TPA: D-alanine--poly(phosphoribitol) ligase subunit DltA [Chthoniobacterales bacterium]|nr:D-alanine--poly(phosphoribitol) ligase subunit DltA [Chthoniobacterales bacterium]
MSLIETIDRWGLVASDAIAHVSEARILTYGELRHRSDALAAVLSGQLDKDRAPIAVLGHREPEMLIAFLGIVKSGRAYVPLDSALPKGRIDKILSLSDATVLLTPREIARLSESAGKTPAAQVRRDDPFYIVFTSGSTGEPKGVTITLGCLEHFVSWMLAEHNFAPQEEVFLNQAPFSFDLSVMDLYCSLATGGTLFSIGRNLVANPKLLYRALANSNVTTWVSTPSFVQMCLVESKFDSVMLPRLRRFLFCGEILTPQTVAQLFARFPNAQVWNTYGPTEATVATTSVRITSEILQRYSTLPVGRTMPGTRVVIVDRQGNVAPPDEIGEIVIAGPNVSPGYLGSPDQTRKVFVNFRGQRAYRTGDRGRICDGFLFFEGRIDRQLKLNGYRIELGDVEENLRALPNVRDAVVLPVIKNGGAQSLAAFVVLVAKPAGSDFETTHSLRNELAQRLPAYMLPRKFVFVDAIPITANGKADRNALAAAL